LYLRLLHRGRVLVTHGADLHATLTFPVTLLEELSHDSVSPLAVQLQWLGGIAEVCTVHHVPKNLHGEKRGGLQRSCPVGERWEGLMKKEEEELGEMGEMGGCGKERWGWKRKVVEGTERARKMGDTGSRS
jgi:hypothetical protein